MVLSSLFTLPLFLSLSVASHISHNHARHEHSHNSARSLPKRWYHDDDHPVHALFKRGPTGGDGVTYEEVGSPTWSAAYPTGTPDASKMPQAWQDALKAAVAAGKIPDIPISKPDPNGGQPVYPGGADPMSKEICSASQKCRSEDDVWDAPDGYLGVNFDDGPYEGSSKLYDFLAKEQLPSTHFMIGLYIQNNPKMFLRAYQELGSDIAVHTYTHPYMTTLSNEDVVAQLGWTMEIIHNSTEGRLPRFWRPPTGDADNRVRAIAKEIFGLQTVMWNQDTEDWSISTGGTTPQVVASQLTKWIQGPKSPGLIILEHELTETTVQLFMDAVPQAKAAGWKIESVSQLTEGKLNEKGNGAWQNVDDSGKVNVALVASGDNNDSNDGDDGDSSSGGSSGSGSPTGSGGSSGSNSGSSGSPTSSGGSSNPSQNPDGGALSLSFSASHLISLVLVGVAALAL